MKESSELTIEEIEDLETAYKMCGDKSWKLTKVIPAVCHFARIGLQTVKNSQGTCICPWDYDADVLTVDNRCAVHGGKP